MKDSYVLSSYDLSSFFSTENMLDSICDQAYEADDAGTQEWRILLVEVIQHKNARVNQFES